MLHAIVEASDDALVTHDAALTVTSWNHGAERLFGYRAAEIVGQSYVALFPEHLQSDARAMFATVMTGDRVNHFEAEIQRKDGMPILISLSLLPVFDDQEAPVASVLIARDLTEQRLAQAALAEVDARVRESEALAHVGSWMWDVRTAAVQWSDEFHRIHGVDPHDFGGTFDSYIEAIHGDDRERTRAKLKESVASGQPFEDEYRVIRAADDVRYVRVRAQPTIGSAGTVLGLRGIGQDVTAVRVTER